MKKILIVEDDESIQAALVTAVELDGHEARTANSGTFAIESFRTEKADLVLLDLMLPEMNGFDVCRKIREIDKRVPIIIVTAKDEEIDKVLGLELGADDYLTKPFSVRELVARIHAALRRIELYEITENSAQKGDTVSFGIALVDRRRFTVSLDGRTERLTAREMNLIEYFMARIGVVLSRDEILNDVWGIDYLGTTRTLDQHIAQLRKKVESTEGPKVIKTVHGVGYRFDG